MLAVQDKVNGVLIATMLGGGGGLWEA